MSKKGVKIATTYFITILVSLVVIGGGGYFIIMYYLNTDIKENDITPLRTSAVNSADYAPTYEDNLTALFIFDSEKRFDGVCFVAVRVLPADGRVVVMPIQSDTYAEVNGKANTIYEFYRLGGTGDAVRAAENALGITVDKYMKLTETSFAIFADYMGNIVYNVPYNLVYQNEQTGEHIIMKEGETILDSESLRKILTFPDYKGGEEYRVTVCGTLITQLINSGCEGILKDNSDTVFTDIINSDVETNITRYDYDDTRPAIKYLLDQNDNPAEMNIPSGVYNENGQYVLDDNFRNALTTIFALDE